jgi:hypothetical protein
MRHVVKCLSFLLLLMAAQQGAVVHELSHVSSIGGPELPLADGVADTTCALCPAFAQVSTPAFSPSFHLPLLVRIALETSAEPISAAIDTAVPRPRSRGPPV